nr:polymerase [Morganella morganii]
MNYDDAFNIIYDNIYLFLSFSLVLFFILYAFTKKLSINGILDPYTFIYTFTYSTSYAVVCILFLNNAISFYSFFIILVMGITYIASVFIFTNIKLPYSTKLSFKKNSNKSHYRNACIIIYITTTLLIIYFKGFSIFTTTNRFEDNRGIGPIVRIFEISTYFLICYYFISINKIKTKKEKIINMSLFFMFLLFNATISGAKADLLFYFLAALISLKAYGSLKKIDIKYIILAFISSTLFALIILYFNFNSSLSGISDSYTVISSIFKRLVDRIISNGDMYYFGLPNDIYQNIEINNPIITFISPVISYSIASKLAGYDTSQFEIGKQLLLYHYPDNTVAGGPVDHFDLFAFSHFGLTGGVLFVILLSYLLCFIRNLFFICKDNVFLSISFTIIWINSLSWLLKPGYILGTLFYILFFYMLLLVINTALQKVSLSIK